MLNSLFQVLKNQNRKHFLFTILVFFLFLACNEVDLASKIHVNTSSAKWTRIYKDFRALEVQITDAEFIINQGIKLINKKAGGQLDSAVTSNFSSGRFQYINLKPTIEVLKKKSKNFHDKYMKDRDLYNRWLDNVNGNHISQDVFEKELKIMENKISNHYKELQKLQKLYQEFYDLNHQISQKIFESAPELSGIIIP